MRNAIHFLGGSLAVYVLMAACSAGGRGSSRGGATDSMANQGGGHEATIAGASNPSGAGDAQQGNGGSSMGGIVDTMMDPTPDAEAAPATSGTRLRARYYIGEDGSKQFAGWHDKLRDEDCFFQKAEDGQLHCLPSSGAVPGYFADAGCTQPVLYAVTPTGGCTAAPVPTQVYMTDICGANRQRFTVSTTVATADIHVKSGATCTAAPAAFYTSFTFYPLLAPEAAPASAFVAATEQVE